MKWKAVPLPGVLSTQIRPPIRSTRRAAMASPNPVPPWVRVVVPSAWAKASKMSACFSAGMPMPVSVTVKCRPCAASVVDSTATRRSRRPAG